MATRMTAKAFQRLAGARTPRSKYHACPTVIDGVRFDSRAEARRYQALIVSGMQGYVRNLELQPNFPLHAPDGALIGRYRADFRYEERDEWDREWTDHVEDVKGVRTSLYRWKKKHFQAEYGIAIRET